MSKIEMGRTYRTRDGREVRIYAVDGGGKFPVHGAFRLNDLWEISWWTAEGKYTMGNEYPRDLIEFRPRIKREVWVNVYSDGTVIGKESRDDRNAYITEGLRARKLITIDCEEGEGL